MFGNLIIPFVLFFLLICDVTTGLGIGRKGPPPPKRQNEDLDANRAMNRTLAKLSREGEHGRFVLLICKGKCLRERTDIPSWIREFNNKIRHHQNHKKNSGEHQQIASNNGTTINANKNGTIGEDPSSLGFYVHFYKKPFPRVDIEKALQKRTSKQTVVAFYVVGGRVFPMGERIGKKDKFMKWLNSFEHPRILVLEDGEIDGWLNSEKCHQQLPLDDGIDVNVNEHKNRRGDQQTVLLVVHDPELCPETLLPNLARSFLHNADLVVLELRRPLTEDDDFLLHWRLPNLGDNCRMDILLHSQFYLELPEGILGSELNKIVHNLTTFVTSNCTNLDAEDALGLQKILDPLNSIETEFLREERHLKAIEHNRQYLIVGAIGGVAVLAMAMSIFWGLNGNDFVPKQ